MTLLQMQGFDENVFDSAITPSSTILGNSGRSSGSLCARVINGAGSGLTFPLSSAPSTAFIGFAHYNQGATATTRFISFYEGATLHCAVGITATGAVTVYGPAGTVVATSAGTPLATVGFWKYLEAKAVIADSGGVVEIKVDGTVVLTYTGDTKNGGTGVINTIEVSITTGVGMFVDDLYILDSAGSAPYNDYLGDVAVRTLVPNGDGSNSDWLGSDGNKVNNYQLVDDFVSTADYVSSFTSGETDLYALTDLVLPNSGVLGVLAVQEIVYYNKSDAGVVNAIKPLAKGQSGTVREDSALPAASTTAQYRSGDLRTTDPDGNALTYARVNAMQIGVRVS